MPAAQAAHPARLGSRSAPRREPSASGPSGGSGRTGGRGGAWRFPRPGSGVGRARGCGGMFPLAQAADPFPCPGGRALPVLPSPHEAVARVGRWPGARRAPQACLPSACPGAPVGAAGRGTGEERCLPPLCLPPAAREGLWALWPRLSPGLGARHRLSPKAHTAMPVCGWDRWDLWCLSVGWGQLSSVGLSLSQSLHLNNLICLLNHPERFSVLQTQLSILERQSTSAQQQCHARSCACRAYSTCIGISGKPQPWGVLMGVALLWVLTLLYRQHPGRVGWQAAQSIGSPEPQFC